MGSEKELEDYICNNVELFISSLQQNEKFSGNIKFLGRQVKIGDNNIADLIFYRIDKKNENELESTYIIVELKNRAIEPKDVAQLSRYVTTLKDKFETEGIDEGFNQYYGVLVGTDLKKETQELQMMLNSISDNITFMIIEPSFRYAFYAHNENYINNLKLDTRFEDAK